MKNKSDYSKYKCPFSHLEYEYSSSRKEFKHELHGPEGIFIWCDCGFRGPISCLDPDELKLELKDSSQNSKQSKCNCGNIAVVHFCNDCLKNHDKYCKVPF
jgi:hypothetical protein